MSKKGKKKATETRKRNGQKRFLAHLRECGVIGTAAARSGLGRATVYEWRSSDPKFAEQWDEHFTLAYDDLEATMLERAKKGNDTMACFVAKARWPAKYRERYEVTIRNNPELRAIVEGVAKVLEEFVPSDRYVLARNRLLSLIGFRGTSFGDDPEPGLQSLPLPDSTNPATGA